MMIRREVKVFEVIPPCPRCKIGTLEFNGTILLSQPPQLTHKCTTEGCEYTQFFEKQYPCHEFQPVLNG